MNPSTTVHSREDACSILGIPTDASETDIKKAYKNLVKLFHPDMGSVEDNEVYTHVVEAYEYLCAHPPVHVSDFTANQAPNKNTPPVSAYQKAKSTGPTQKSTPNAPNTRVNKILGSGTPSYRSGSNQADFEKKYREQKAKKAAEFDQRMQNYAAEQKRREEEYRRTMEAIRTIRLAEALKKMLRESDQDK